MKKLTNNLKSILVLRSGLFLILTVILNYLLDLNTSLILVCFANFLGIYCATAAYHNQINGKGFFALNIIILLLYFITNFFITQLSATNIIDPQIFFKITSDFELLIIFLLVSSFFTWLLLRSKEGLTLELIFLCVAFIQVLSSHRNFRFDLMSDLNQIAWDFNLHPLSMLIITGALIAGFIITYLIMIDSQLADLQGRRQYQKKSLAISLIIMFAIITGISFGSYNLYQKQAGTALKNGVGEENQDGVAPLDFHQNLGASTQPAALVRLAGDYAENPFNPVIYFRESAASKIQDNKIVISRSFDRDLNFTNPKDNFSATWTESDLYRKQVTQAIYLLANHKLAFALDYPSKIRRLSLPEDTNKFKSAYQVESLAPSFDYKNLDQFEVGRSDWTGVEWSHYTENHRDPRYKELANKIAGDLPNRTLQAIAIVEYLNKKSIYTLRPNHEGTSEEDQAAKYLFGDLRGYCVHFAYAATYLFRSLGIPARVASGYMSDLSQAKDGHILLRMNDRHAWSEIYLKDLGWIPFDIQPEQVEIHGEAPVDQQTLEELMGLIGPQENLLPDSLLDQELSEQSKSILISFKQIFLTLLSIISLIYLIKLYLYFAHHLPISEERKQLFLLRKIYALLTDLNLSRKFSETRIEHENRISKNNYNFAQHALAIIYNNQKIQSSELKKSYYTIIQNLNCWKKILAIINIKSSIHFIMRRKW